MTSNAAGLGELIYEYTLKFTGMTDYGVTMEAISTGQAPVPPQGARFDVAFEGVASGPKFNSSVAGVDYLNMRADGKVELHIHATMTDEAGERVAVCASGVGTPREGSPVFDLRENVTLTSASPAYAWVNALQVWGVGTVDTAQGQVKVKGYA